MGLGRSYHRSYFLLELECTECDDYRVILRGKVGSPMIPLGAPGKYAEGKMANSSPTIPIDIYRTPDKVENVYIGVDCSPNEIEAYTKLFK